MRIAVGSDARTPLSDRVIEILKEKGHELKLLGPITESSEKWVAVGVAVGEAVRNGECDFGIALCWTGTGISIAANKVPGVRAALCHDAGTALGARKWNDANVLCLSLRSTGLGVVLEILDTWFSTEPSKEAGDLEQIAQLKVV